MNNNPTYMQCGISALLSGLKSPTVAQYSCRIIYEISKKFPLTIQPFVDEIIPILEVNFWMLFIEYVIGWNVILVWRLYPVLLM